MLYILAGLMTTNKKDRVPTINRGGSHMKKERGYWDYIELPVYAMVLWSIVGILLLAFDILNPIAQAIIGYIVVIAAYSYIGYQVRKDGGRLGSGAKKGAVAGVIVGFAGAVIALVSLYYMPQVFEAQIQAALEAYPQLTRDQMMANVKIGVYFGFISGPAVSAGMGALISLIANAITGAVRKK
jgi:hypothetical protein